MTAAQPGAAAAAVADRGAHRVVSGHDDAEHGLLLGQRTVGVGLVE
jgi:hypothetical protein